MGRMIREPLEMSILWDVLDGLQIPALHIDSDFRLTDINSSAERALLYRNIDITGARLQDIIDVPVSSAADLPARKSVTFDGACVRKDRESFPAKITFIRLASGFIVTAEDRSDQIKLELRAAHRRKEINTYNALSRTMSRAQGLQEITSGALDTLVTEMDFDAAWIFLVDDTGRLRPFGMRGNVDSTEDTLAGPGQFSSFSDKVFSSGKALIVKNTLDDPRVSEDVSRSGFNSVAAIPVISKNIDGKGGRIVGVLGAADRMQNYFSPLDIQFLTTVGNLLGVAIENAGLIADLREKIKQIRLINEISGVVNSSLSIGHIFRLVFSEIRQIVEFDRASITLLKENSNLLEIFAIDTRRPTRLTKGVHAPLEGTSAGWVTVNRKPWINRDLEEEMAFPLDDALRREGIRATISVPLYKDSPLGALNLDSVHPGKYSEKDLDILMPVTKHLSIALENAILFEEISREKREWEKTFDAITDMVWIEDLQGHILRVNRAVVKNSGRAEIALIQRSSSELFRSLRIPEGVNLSYESIEHKRQLFKEIRGSAGSIYYFWTYPLLNSEGRIYGVVNYLRDVTEQKKLEQKLIRADKLASLGILVAGVAHEINNPLGIIAGYSEALLDRATDPALRNVEAFADFPEYLETINNEIFRCKDILKALLDFARPGGGTFRMIDINGLIKEVMLLVKHGAKTQKHRITLDLQSDLPETLADAGAMRQVLLNIIMNAFYFLDKEGEIVISTSLERRPYERDEIRIAVSDNGRGISSENLNRIFDPFFSTKEVGEGTGLGLSICHRIVHEHEGNIDVESEPGEGTTFTITIPVRSKESEHQHIDR
jgi:two-component system NtrC family sensor kinase